MSLVQAEADLVSAYEAATTTWTGNPIITEYPNRRLLNSSNLPPVYVQLAIIPLSGVQLDLNPRPSTRVGGQFQLTVNTLVGEGSRMRAAIVDHLMQNLEMLRLSDTSTGAATLGRMQLQSGRELLPILVPFWFYRIKS